MLRPRLRAWGRRLALLVLLPALLAVGVAGLRDLALRSGASGGWPAYMRVEGSDWVPGWWRDPRPRCKCGYLLDGSEGHGKLDPRITAQIK